MTDGSYSVEEIAQVVHEANRALQRINGDLVSSPWEECGAEMQASIIDGVRVVQSGATAKQSHENWVRFKIQHGWTYGKAKSEAEKTHPCLVDYEDLPESQRVKDDLFGAIVGALSADG